MKTLYLVRHATAEDGSYSSMFRDFDRNLTSKGIIESARMGKFLASKEISFDLLISSQAIRAHETAKIMAEQLKIDSDSIVLDENIYGGGPRAYLSAVNQLEESITTVAIFGHNPDISFFGEYLTRDDTGGSMEKSAVLVLSFPANLSWKEVSSKSGSVVASFTPETIS